MAWTGGIGQARTGSARQRAARLERTSTQRVIMDSETRKLLHARLEKIRAKAQGVLTPDDVVKDARSASSPLHSHFTWDDSEAAHQFRLEQARTLIRNVRVEVSTSTVTMAAPFYIRDPRCGTQQGYASVAEIKTDRQVSADALKMEIARVIGVYERAASIAEELGLSSHLEQAINAARSLQQVVEKVATKNPKSTKRPKTATA